jgi:mRNA interferase RelE/StbE
MSYTVSFTKPAIRSIEKLDRHTRDFLFAWIFKNLDGTIDPKMNAKSLKGPLKGLWRYRIGTYRILAEINEKEVVILILDVGHRKNIYSKKP